MKEGISLHDLVESMNNLHIKIEKDYLKELIQKASQNKKPHKNQELISYLGMKCTKGLDRCMTIYGWINYNKTIPLDKLDKIISLTKSEWKEAERKIISLKKGQHGGEIKINFPIILNEDLGRLAGHILGDGSIDKKYQQVFFSNTDKDLLIEFLSLMNKIFKIKPRIWMQKAPDFGNTHWDKRLNKLEEIKEGRNVGLFYPSICGLIINKILGNFAIGKDKKITNEIKNANKDFKRGLIRAFFDDESRVSIQRRYIRVFQDRKEMLEIIRSILEKDFDIVSQPIKIYKKRDKERYYFDIYKSNANLLKYSIKIGYTSTKKENKLREILS